VNICSNYDSREEIVFDSRKCPLCEAKAEIEKLTEQKEELEVEVGKLEKQLAENQQ
jgi:hypothetical protein